MNLNRLIFLALIANFSFSLSAMDRFSSKDDFANEIASLQKQIATKLDSPWIKAQSKMILETHIAKVNKEKLLVPALDGCCQMAIMFNRADLAAHFFELYLQFNGDVSKEYFVSLLELSFKHDSHVMALEIIKWANGCQIQLDAQDISAILLGLELAR